MVFCEHNMVQISIKLRYPDLSDNARSWRPGRREREARKMRLSRVISWATTVIVES